MSEVLFKQGYGGEYFDRTGEVFVGLEKVQSEFSGSTHDNMGHLYIVTWHVTGNPRATKYDPSKYLERGREFIQVQDDHIADDYDRFPDAAAIRKAIAKYDELAEKYKNAEYKDEAIPFTETYTGDELFN